MRDFKATHTADILVVGNGALGLFLAREIVARDQSVKLAIVGPSHRDGGASQAAGAMLGCFCEVTEDTFKTSIGRSRFEIGLASHDLWTATLHQLEAFCPDNKPLKVADETHVILNSVGSDFDTKNFQAIMDALIAYERPWSEIEPADVPGLNPKPSSRAFRALSLPTEGAIDARAVLQALENGLQTENVALFDCMATEICLSKDKVTGVRLEDGTVIEAGKVIVAAGAFSEKLINDADEGLEILPTFPGLGMGLISKRLAGPGFQSVVRTPNRAFACGLHVVPNSDGTEYLGSTNRLVPEVAKGACLEDLSYFTRSAMEQLDENIEHHQIERLLVGNRPVTIDGFPLIGALPIDGLYLMTGTYRDGFHCAPQLAINMTNELFGSPQNIHAQFSPSREPIFSKSIETAVDEFVEHSVAMWYESGANAPFPTSDFAAYRRDQAIRQYERLGISYGLNPDVLWHTIRYPAGIDRIVNYFKRHRVVPAAASDTSLASIA